jgi:hypothetical protein
MALFAERGSRTDTAAAAKRLRSIDPTVNLAAQQSDTLGQGRGIMRDGAKEPPPRVMDDDDMDDGGGGSVGGRTTIIHDINRCVLSNSSTTQSAPRFRDCYTAMERRCES